MSGYYSQPGQPQQFQTKRESYNPMMQGGHDPTTPINSHQQISNSMLPPAKSANPNSNSNSNSTPTHQQAKHIVFPQTVNPNLGMSMASPNSASRLVLSSDEHAVLCHDEPPNLPWVLATVPGSHQPPPGRHDAAHAEHDGQPAQAEPVCAGKRTHEYEIAGALPLSNDDEREE